MNQEPDNQSPLHQLAESSPSNAPQHPGRSFVEFLANAPDMSGLDLSRDQDPGRDVEL